ncbi:MAG: reverse transcriptase domain-containing protein [Sedimenticola sp.]
MKKGKAPDYEGMSAEHYAYGGDRIYTYLGILVTAILNSGRIPKILKTGVVTPVHKKKDTTNPNNYRGISVSTVVGKMVQILCLEILEPLLADTQSGMQRGFTAGTSCINAALIVSEVLNENRDTGTETFLATLDAQKAFDVVWHQSLLRKLYHDGVIGNMWLLLRDFLVDSRSCVKWEGGLSRLYGIGRGVRQGDILSPMEYKRFNNSMLQLVTSSRVGAKIGTVMCNAPTCADDVAVLAEGHADLQFLLDTVGNNSRKEHYNINSTKSEIVNYPMAKSRSIPEHAQQHTINGEQIPYCEEATHLGIVRSNSSTINSQINTNIKCAAKTVYAMMGTGFHGKNGLGQKACLKIWNIYVIPRLTYGLEVISLKKKDFDTIEKYQKKTLKAILSLPERVADAAVYSMSGVLPIRAVIDRNALTLFGSILRKEDSIEYQLCRRQLAVKPITSSSWFVRIRQLLCQYDLPGAYDLLDDPPCKLEWKKTIRNNIRQKVYEEVRAELGVKTSGRFIGTANYLLGEPHQVWNTVDYSVADVRKSNVKAKLLTGSMTLQANLSRFNQYGVSPTCLMCGENPEDRKHLILECGTLKSVRKPYIDQITNIIKEPCTREQLLQCTLDSSANAEEMNLSKSECTEIERISRNLCFDLYARRCTLLNIPILKAG